VSWCESMLGGGLKKGAVDGKCFTSFKKRKPFYEEQGVVLWLIKNVLWLTKFFKCSQTPENNEKVL
jgi:hypothetical protein